MSRINKLIELIDEVNLSSMIITSPANIFYFTGYMGPGFLYIPVDGKIQLYVYPLDYNVAETYCNVKDIEIVKLRLTSGIVDVLRSIAENYRRRVGFDKLEVEQYLRAKEYVEELKPSSELTWKLRMIKEGEEIERIKKAAEITSRCMELASEIIDEGVKESEVKAEILEEMMELGSWGPAAPPIIASGPKSALPHGGPGDRQFQKGDVVVVDISAVYEGYCADMTRTYYVGSNPPEEIQKVYQLVYEAKSLVEEGAKSWLLASSIDEVARSKIASQGYGDYFTHGLGHGIGIEIHEPPRINPVSQEMLQENYVITIEPGIYLPRRFGVRIEDTFMVERDSLIKLTSSPYDFTLY
ncbi:MAG: Xaa-Pro peptidase family protein [Nitrososphaerota archaeon]|nr:Xaa-Pro peptidase family protein [Candidatus Geocrenenecus dongiae]